MTIEDLQRSAVKGNVEILEKCLLQGMDEFFVCLLLATRICDVASERRHKSVEVEFEFLVFTNRLDHDEAVFKIWCKNSIKRQS